MKEPDTKSTQDGAQVAVQSFVRPFDVGLDDAERERPKSGDPLGSPFCSSLSRIDQDLVTAIHERAKTYMHGIEDPPEKPMQLDTYNPPDTSFALAAALIGGYTGKYDLVALMQAVIEIGQEAEKRALAQGRKESDDRVEAYFERREDGCL